MNIKDPMTITTFDQAIAEIESGLSELRQLALKTNFDNSDERQNYLDRVNYLKQFYERAERLALDE